MPEGYALVREKIIVKGSLLCSERAYKCRTDGVECKVGWVWAKIKERLQQQWETSFTVTLSCWCAESLLPKQCPIHPPLVMYLLSCTLNHLSLQNRHWTCWPIWWHDENIALHRSLLLRYTCTEPIWSKQSIPHFHKLALSSWESLSEILTLVQTMPCFSSPHSSGLNFHLVSKSTYYSNLDNHTPRSSQCDRIT